MVPAVPLNFCDLFLSSLQGKIWPVGQKGHWFWLWELVSVFGIINILCTGRTATDWHESLVTTAQKALEALWSFNEKCFGALRWSLTLQLQWTCSWKLYAEYTHHAVKTSLTWQSTSAKLLLRTECSSLSSRQHETVKGPHLPFLHAILLFNVPVWKLGCDAGCGEHRYSMEQFFWSWNCSSRDLTPSGTDAKMSCRFLRQTALC